MRKKLIIYLKPRPNDSIFHSIFYSTRVKNFYSSEKSSGNSNRLAINARLRSILRSNVEKKLGEKSNRFAKP